MPDITQLILDDHDTFRRQFAALDDADGPDALHAVWKPLADLLEVHAAAEETIFYPQLLRRGDDAEDETVDAIGDHNDIRDGVREAARHPIAARSGGTVCGRPAGPTAITWPRRKTTPSPTSGETLRSMCVRTWGANLASSRPTTPVPKAATPTTRTQKATSAQCRRRSLRAKAARWVSAV